MLEIDTQEGPFRVYARGTITRALQAGQWWDSHLRAILDEHQGGVAVDIGAHFGWFTRYLATTHPRVYACEPWAPSFALLQENVLRPLVDRWHGDVQCWPVAAYDRVAALGFAAANDRTDEGNFAFFPTTPLDPLEYVPAAPLDNYLPADAHITVVKCDAQGADLQALQGMAHAIRRCRPSSGSSMLYR